MKGLCFFGVRHVFLLCFLAHFVYYMCTWLHVFLNTFNIFSLPNRKKEHTHTHNYEAHHHDPKPRSPGDATKMKPPLKED